MLDMDVSSVLDLHKFLGGRSFMLWIEKRYFTKTLKDH